MKYEFKSSFDKSLKRFSETSKTEIKRLAFEIVDIIATGKAPSKGYKLTRLREDYWEARASIKERVLFKLTRDTIQFIAVGNHEDVKRFLKRV